MIYIAGYDGEIGGFGELADFILARERAQIARARELLDKCESIFAEMDAITWCEESGWQGSSYDEVADEVREYLDCTDEIIKKDD